MEIKKIFVFGLIVIAKSQVYGQAIHKHSAEFGVLGTRQSVVNYLGYQFSRNLWHGELALGYDVSRVVQYSHFSPSLIVGAGYGIIVHEKTQLNLKTNFMYQWNHYPSNPDLVSRSMYVGYELKHGQKIQFSQRLMLGVLNNSALSGMSNLTHDFLFAVGIHYVF